MNVFQVSFGIYIYYAVAKNEEEAIKKVQERESLHHLAFTAKQIDLEGYKLVKAKQEVI